MLHDNHAKSYLSESYVHAVVTQAGYLCNFARQDYGVDAVISETQEIPKIGFWPTGYQFNLQIKATHDFKKVGKSISYDLEADAYNKLLHHEGGFIVLVVFCLPKDANERVALTENCLRLKNCCYWYHVTGAPTPNKNSKTIKIPRAQMFTPGACKELMDLVRNDGWKQ